MFARVTRFRVDIDRREEATRISDTRIAPALRQAPGFGGMHVLVDPVTGEGMVLTLWETPGAERESRAKVGRSFASLGDILTASPAPSEVYEIVARLSAPTGR